MTKSDNTPDVPDPRPPESVGDAPQSGVVDEAVQIRAAIRATGEGLPQPLQHAAFSGANNEPEIVVQSAEGVGTFRGFNGANAQPEADAWLERRFKEIEEAYPPPNPARTGSGSH